jgi:rubredoxin
MICKGCNHIFINELVDVCEFGYGDNVTEYVVCPKCGHRQRLGFMEIVIREGEMGRV